MNKKAVSNAGIEMYVQILNPAESDKKKWIIKTNTGKKLTLNNDEKTFNCPEHGQEFRLLD